MKKYKIFCMLPFIIVLPIIVFSIWVGIIVGGYRLSVDRVNNRGDEAVLIHEGNSSNRNVLIRSLDGKIYSVSLHTVGMDVEFQDMNGDGKWDVWSIDIESNTNKLYYLYSRFSGYPYAAYGDQPQRVLIDGHYYEAENDGTNTYVILNGHKIDINFKHDMSGFEFKNELGKE